MRTILENTRSDKRTRLVSGDFSRMAIVFAILAVIGLIGGLFWFDFYEVGWEILLR